MKTQRTNSRSGFTAIEILIVVAIIALLMSIVAGAVFRVKSASEKTATETTLTKLASLLDRHWKATIESAKKEFDGLPSTVKQNLVSLADNRAPGNVNQPYPHPRRGDRAKLLYVKFRLKQEFPASFAEVLTPLAVMTVQPPNFLDPPAPPPYYFVPPQSASATQLAQLPGIPNPTTGKTAYVSFITDFAKKNNLNLANLNQFPSLRYQSAILMVLALEQSRSGVAPVNLEQEIGTTFVLTGRDDVEAAKGSPARSIILPGYLADTWGNPLQLYIFPTAQAVSATDLAITGTNGDPQDPEGLLHPTPQNKWTAPINNFNTLLHVQMANRRLIPVIASAGPDGEIGDSGTMPATPGWAAFDPTMNLSSPGSFDNIYSFRLRQSGARGD